jgi:hypothetical protein
MSRTFWELQRKNPYPSPGAFSAPGAHSTTFSRHRVYSPLRSKATYGAEEEKSDPTGLGKIVVPLAMIAIAYFAFFAKPAPKKRKANPRKRRRNQERPASKDKILPSSVYRTCQAQAQNHST